MNVDHDLIMKKKRIRILLSLAVSMFTTGLSKTLEILAEKRTQLTAHS